MALSQVGPTGGTTGEFVQQGDMRSDMFRELLIANLVIADLSIHNANAFYELGIRHAFKSQYTVMIKADKRGDPHVFDLKVDKYFPYDPDHPSQAVVALVQTIKATLDNEKPDSPVFQLLPGLTSFDAGKVVVVPLKFREQVEQAASMREERLNLCAAVAGQAWEKEGLRMLGGAQFKLGDHENSAKPGSVFVSSTCLMLRPIKSLPRSIRSLQFRIRLQNGHFNPALSRTGNVQRPIR